MWNWCWGKWSFKFDTLLPYIWKLPFVEEKKLKILYKEVEVDLCDSHDDDFTAWGGLFAFLRANYFFSLWLIRKLYWTTKIGRILVFLLSFFWLSIFWIRFFNWTNIL
jgi:hypothetical protein